MSVYERVEAIQWTGENYVELVRFGATVRQSFLGPLDLLTGADGAQGYVPVPVGHWVVRSVGDNTDHWPVADSCFRNRYRQADDEVTT